MAFQAKQPHRKISAREVRLFIRIVLAVTFLTLGFNISRSAFFKEYPLFGINYLAEIFISTVAALLGFYTVPKLLLKIQSWFEYLISKTIANIVSDFWEQQTKKINEAKREKQRRKAEEQKQKMVNGALVDTSVLIDGRIENIVKAGFWDRPLIIPRIVLRELQQVADSKNKTKRQRGRRGFDILKSLKKRLTVEFPDIASKTPEVDSALIDFAKKNKLRLMTMDFNLAKAAEVAGVEVLNINKLVESLKIVFLPGEETKVKIMQKGKEKGQGVGFLEDGTMIVVRGASDMIGQEVSVRVSKVIQSEAGKMIFCDLLK